MLSIIIWSYLKIKYSRLYITSSYDPRVNFSFKRKKEENGIFSWGDFSSEKIVIILLGPMRSYTVKENHIGLAAGKILRDRQTQINIMLLLYKSYRWTKHTNKIALFKWTKFNKAKLFENVLQWDILQL